MKSHPNIHVRPATYADRAQISAVEAKSTPGLHSVAQVFDLFMRDKRGEFIVAEIDGEVVACGKFTVVPDGSAWLETLRVLPDRQRLGIGKRFYEHFFAVAKREGVWTMRMYTGTKNVVSKGLVERFGFQLAATFASTQLRREPSSTPANSQPPLVTDLRVDLQQVTDPAHATELILAHHATWNGYLVMNRTFYKLTPQLCVQLAGQGQVYVEAATDSVIVMGARFMPEQALHIGLFGGDATRCLAFTQSEAIKRNIPQISCLFPGKANGIQDALISSGLALEETQFIVMECHL